MNEPSQPVVVDFRIPGQWSHPRELIERLPDGCRVTPNSLILPDGARLDLGFAEPDRQFPGIFRSSCRRTPTAEERTAVDGYTVNVLLSGKGGSMDAARTLMAAAAAMVRAGGAGVFIDNCGLAHGGKFWLEMTDDGSSDAVSFAFVSIIRGEADVWTLGMHVLGLRDVVMSRADVEEEGFDIVEVICYLARGENPVEDGHIIGDLSGPQFQCRAEDGDARLAGTPMYNPFGRHRLVRLGEIGRSN